MERINKKFFNYLYIYILAAISSILWLFAFMVNNELLTLSFDIEQVGFIIIGLIVFFVLALIRDSFYMMPLLVYTPFMFARGFDEQSIPIAFYIVIGLAVLGIIVHIIRFREKIKIGVYTLGLGIFLLGIVLGGIVSNEIIINKILLLVIGGLLILVAYNFIVTYLKKHSFDELAHIMTALGLIMVFQSVSNQYLLHRDLMFQAKNIVVGWGISNNIAMILLLCTPFTMYLCSKGKLISNLVYLLLVILFFGIIVLTYSRGAMLMAMLTFPFILIYSFIQSKNKLSFGINVSIILACFVAIIIYLHSKKPEMFEALKREISKINLESLNGRDPIYEEMLTQVKDHLWFGKGMFNSVKEDGVDYLWGHNVYIHTIYTLGLFGFITLLVHLFQKYYLLLKKPNAKKVFVAAAFFSCGLYGLFDVTYFYLNYMIVMIAILALVHYEIKE